MVRPSRLFAVVFVLSFAVPAHGAVTCNEPRVLCCNGFPNTPPAIESPRAVVAADFDGDGLIDFAVANYRGLWIVRQTLEPVYLAGFPTAVRVYTTSIFAVSSADLNGDGIPDLVATTDDLRLVTFLGKGDGSFTEHAMAVPRKSPLVVGDFTGDGKPDVVVKTSSPAVLLYAGNGDGTLNQPLSIPLAQVADTFTAADLDGDGKLDLILAEGASLDVELGTGSGGFTHASTIALPDAPSRPLIADLDGDGQPDVAVAIPNAYIVLVMRGLGDGTFAAPASYRWPQTTPPKPKLLAAGDFTRRGRVDLVVAGEYHDVYFLPSNGDGTFGAFTPLPNTKSGHNYTDLLAVDHDGDSKIDLVLPVDVYSFVLLARNGCGVADVGLQADYAVISTTQRATLTASVYGSADAPATGSVTFRDGSQTIATVPLIEGVATVSPALTTGSHTIVATYTGDANYDPRASRGTTVTVTAMTTTTTLTSSTAVLTANTEATLTATVTSTDGADFSYASFRLIVDGIPSTSFLGPYYFLGYNSHAPGAHTYAARYEGDSSHPPSTSAPVTIVSTPSAPSKRRSAPH